MCDFATSDLMPTKRLRTAGSEEEEEEEKPCGGHVQEERRGVDVVSDSRHASWFFAVTTVIVLFCYC